MRKLAIWVLVMGLVLGIGFAAAACDGCQGNLPQEKEINIKLKVVKWAELTLLDGCNMVIGYCRPGEALSGNNDLRFNGRSNTPVKLTFTSDGFDPEAANAWISYYVSLYPGWLEDARAAGWGNATISPKTSATVGPGQGKWHGHVKANGTWTYENWEEYTAGEYNDKITITVTAAS